MAVDNKGRSRGIAEAAVLEEWSDLIGTHAVPVVKGAGTTQASGRMANHLRRAQYARFIVQCNQAHTVKVYGWIGTATADPAAAVLLYSSARADNSATHGDGDHLVNIAGFDGCFCTVTNTAGADASIWTRGALLAGV